MTARATRPGLRAVVAAALLLVSAGACAPGESGGGATSSGGGGGGSGGATTSSGGAGVTATGGTCGQGGAPLPPDSPDPGDPLNQVVACSSGRTWSGGNGETMYPGDPCQGCHIWSISGTVYPTGHEQPLCNGLDGTGADVKVVVTDALCRVITLVPNSVGNFFYQGTVNTPVTAKIVRGGVTRAMHASQFNTECNACHTPQGLLGAPGRIVPPPP